MSQRITRRQLLGSGIKAGFGLALWKELNLGTVPAFAFTPARLLMTRVFSRPSRAWMNSSPRTCATWARRE